MVKEFLGKNEDEKIIPLLQEIEESKINEPDFKEKDLFEKIRLEGGSEEWDIIRKKFIDKETGLENEITGIEFCIGITNDGEEELLPWDKTFFEYANKYIALSISEKDKEGNLSVTFMGVSKPEKILIANNEKYLDLVKKYEGILDGYYLECYGDLYSRFDTSRMHNEFGDFLEILFHALKIDTDSEKYRFRFNEEGIQENGVIFKVGKEIDPDAELSLGEHAARDIMGYRYQSPYKPVKKVSKKELPEVYNSIDLLLRNTRNILGDGLKD